MPGPPATKSGEVLPEDFRFGVATAGFQIEGGYNGPGEPANNWYGWEASGRVEPSGIALGFWDRYEEYLDLAVGLGCNSFRLSVEWARVETADGVFDDEALAHYRDILAACHARGLEPLVTLHHFTHPGWFGELFWLRPDAPKRFLRWVAVAHEALYDLCQNWITTNECNILAVESFVVGSFPPGGMGKITEAALALDHLMTAHVLAYDEIHQRQPDAVVATNNFSLSLYELDRMPTDLLTARHHGVERQALGAWLAGRRATHYSQTPMPRSPVHRALEVALRRLSARAFPTDAAYPNTTEAIYASSSSRFLDVAQIDYYAPGAAEHFVLPGSRTAGGRNLLPARPLWDDPPDPQGLTRACLQACEPELDLWVVENGMCNRLRRGRSYHRDDRWTRDRYLRENLAAVVAARDQGAAGDGLLALDSGRQLRVGQL